MSDLGDRMEKILKAGGAPGAEPPSVVEVARSLREHFGSGRKAAAAMGVNESTFRRIVSGKTAQPKSSTIGAFERASRSIGTRKISLADIVLPVTPRRGGERSARDRELKAKNLKITDPAAADRIRSAFVDGGKEAAAAQLIREIKDPHYRAWLVPEQMAADMPDIEIMGDYDYGVS